MGNRNISKPRFQRPFSSSSKYIRAYFTNTKGLRQINNLILFFARFFHFLKVHRDMFFGVSGLSCYYYTYSQRLLKKVDPLVIFNFIQTSACINFILQFMLKHCILQMTGNKQPSRLKMQD